MVQFIESELVLLKKEIDEMWTLVYNQLGRAGEAVLTLDRELAQQVLVRERRVNAFELKIDSDIEDIIALYNCLLYTSPSPRDRTRSRMPSSA